MDGNKFENSLSSASILKYEISSKFPCRSRSFDCRSLRGNNQSLHSSSSIRDYSYGTSGKNSLELIELSSINKVSLGFLL